MENTSKNLNDGFMTFWVVKIIEVISYFLVRIEKETQATTYKN